MTQEEIARKLNVSRRTVARALSGDPRISQATRREILKYCAGVGYEKNRVGSLLASPQRTLNAYLLISTNEKYLSQTTDGILAAQKQLGANKIKFNIYSSEIGKPDEQVSLLDKTLKKDRPDGIIIIPISIGEIVKILDKHDYRNVVTIDKSLNAETIHIGSNYKKFGEIAAQILGLVRKPEEKLLVLHTNGDGISSDDYYEGLLSELRKTGVRNYECVYVQDIRENMDKILEYKDMSNVKYIFASRFLSEIISYLESKKYNDIKYVACSINDRIKELIRSGKVISGMNINYHLHGYLAAKAAFKMINSDWKPVHYITNNQIIVKGNLNNLDDNNIVEMQTLFNIL